MRPLDWKDYAFAAALFVVAILAVGAGLESALAREDTHAVEMRP